MTLKNSIHRFSFLLAILSMVLLTASCKSRRAVSDTVSADSPYIENQFPGIEPGSNPKAPEAESEESEPQEEQVADESNIGDPSEESDEVNDEQDEEDGPKEMTEQEKKDRERAEWEMQRKQQIKRGLTRFGLLVAQLAMDFGIWYLLTR